MKNKLIGMFGLVFAMALCVAVIAFCIPRTVEAACDSPCGLEDLCGKIGQKTLICHVPVGDPENAQTLCINHCGAANHLTEMHGGDYCGECFAAGECGNGICEEGENHFNCREDCLPSCPLCEDGQFYCPPWFSCIPDGTRCGSCPDGTAFCGTVGDYGTCIPETQRCPPCPVTGEYFCPSLCGCIPDTMRCP